MDTITITRTTLLPATADAVWREVQRPSAFVTVTRGLLRFPAIEDPTATLAEGEGVVGWLWLFGVLPVHRHHLTITRIDDDRRVLVSDEHGGLVRSWVHDIVVEPVDDRRCSYTDRVAIAAGWATVPIAVFAWSFYRVRQRRWRALAARLAAGGGSTTRAAADGG